MLITTCSHCHAKFRVTEQHLSAADGLVVCSRCRGIFQAKDSLHNMAESKPKAAARPAAKISAQLFGTNLRSGRSRPSAAPATDPWFEAAQPQPETDTFSATAAPEEPIDQDPAPSEPIADAPKPSFFARLFGKRKSQATPDSEEKTDQASDHTTEGETAPDTDDTAAPSSEALTDEASAIEQEPEPEEIVADIALTDADEATPPINTPNNEEFSTVPEPQATEQLALEDKTEEQSFLPGAHNAETPAPYDPRFDPRLYPPPPTREEMNWTMASIVALIVLIIQLFYIILQK